MRVVAFAREIIPFGLCPRLSHLLDRSEGNKLKHFKIFAKLFKSLGIEQEGE